MKNKKESIILIVLCLIFPILVSRYQGKIYTNTLNEDEYDLKVKKMLYPTVAVYAPGNKKGSGVLFKKENKFYIISARHVFINPTELAFLTLRSKNNPLAKYIDITFKIKVMMGNVFQFYKSKIVYIDKQYDFVIGEVFPPETVYIKSIYDRNLPLYSADIATGKIDIFDKVYAIGYPGKVQHPIISFGVLSTANEFGLTGFSAQVAPGNSGGPVFDANTYKCIGIVIAIYTIKNYNYSHYLTHTGLMLPMDKIMKGINQL